MTTETSQEPDIEIPAASHPKQVEGYEVKRLPCCYFLQDGNGRTVLSLNNTSALIWGLCSGEWSVEEIVDTLKESFPDAADAIGDDVDRVLKEFHRYEVIELA